MSRLSPLLDKRLGIALLILLLATVASVAHFAFWYGARLRSATPAPRSAAILAIPGVDAAVWVAFPHQTLPALQTLVLRTDREATAALFRLAGVEPPRLPGFGPLTLPPSREVAVGWRRGGEEGEDAVVASAHIYPLVASFARFSGSLTANPWLVGGEVSRDGSPGVVSWRDGWWTVEQGVATADPSPPVAATSASPHLALLDWRGGDEVPPGRYGLRLEEGGSLVLAPSPALAVGVAVPSLAGHGFAMLRWDGLAGRALAILGSEGGGDLPRALGAHRRGGPRFELPGESLLKLAGRAPRRDRHQGMVIESLDRSGLAAGRRLLPVLPTLVDLDRLLWIDIPLARGEVERIADLLSEVPLLPRRTVAPWQDGARVLAALEAAGWRSVAVAVHGPTARIELSR